MKYLSLLIISIFLSSCQCSSEVSAVLSQVESIMQDKPEEALEQLRVIDSLSLPNRKVQAKYALLYSQALDKNYIDIANDSLIRIAADYYRNHGSVKNKFMSQYYWGRVQANAYSYTMAMVSFINAEQLLPALNDDYLAGLLYAEMSRIYAMQHDYTHSLETAQAAYTHFTNAGYCTHRNYALLSIGLAYGNTLKYNKSSAIFDKVLSLAQESCDTILWASCLSNYASQYIETNKYAEAQNALLKKSSVLHQPLDIRDLSCLSYVYEIGNMSDSSQVYMNKAWQLAENSIDSANLYFRSFQIERQRNNYRDALNGLEKSVQLQDSIVRQTLQQSVISAQKDFFQEQTELISYKLKAEKRLRILSFAFFAFIIVVVVLYLRWRLQLKNAEINKYMNMSNEIRNTLAVETSGMSELIQLLFKDKFEFIDQLGCTYYERQNSDNEQEAIYKSVKRAILNLGSDKRTKAELERIVDACNDNIMQKLRSQITFSRDADYELLCYIYAGFSYKAICIFTQDKIGNVYNRKSRLKSRILSSDAKDKNIFVKMIR